MFHVFVTFEVVMYFKHRENGEGEILQPAGQGGRPPLALTRGLLVCVLKKKHV